MKRSLSINNKFNLDDTTNPMDGVSNMSDAMLVLAVGIMLALVINWKIDIKDVYNAQDKKEQVNEEDLQYFDEDNAKQTSNISFEDIESKYVKSGTVYTDTVSGKSYVVIDE